MESDHDEGEQGREISAQERANRGGPLLGRTRGFVKEHPATVLAAAAGVGAVMGVELAAGALIGIVATELVEHTRLGDMANGRVRGALNGGRRALARGLRTLEGVVAPREGHNGQQEREATVTAPEPEPAHT